jgi:hypothetical protein
MPIKVFLFTYIMLPVHLTSWLNFTFWQLWYYSRGAQPFFSYGPHWHFKGIQKFQHIIPIPFCPKKSRKVDGDLHSDHWPQSVCYLALVVISSIFIVSPPSGQLQNYKPHYSLGVFELTKCSLWSSIRYYEMVKLNFMSSNMPSECWGL